MRFVTRLIPTFTSLATSMTAAACSSEARLPSDPNEGASSASAVATVDSALGSGSVSRIEIELFPGELVAREVHVEADDAEEKIVSESDVEVRSAWPEAPTSTPRKRPRHRRTRPTPR